MDSRDSEKDKVGILGMDEEGDDSRQWIRDGVTPTVVQGPRHITYQYHPHLHPQHVAIQNQEPMAVHQQHFPVQRGTVMRPMVQPVYITMDQHGHPHHGIIGSTFHAHHPHSQHHQLSGHPHNLGEHGGHHLHHQAAHQPIVYHAVAAQQSYPHHDDGESHDELGSKERPPSIASANGSKNWKPLEESATTSPSSYHQYLVAESPNPRWISDEAFFGNVNVISRTSSAASQPSHHHHHHHDSTKGNIGNQRNDMVVQIGVTDHHHYYDKNGNTTRRITNSRTPAVAPSSGGEDHHHRHRHQATTNVKTEQQNTGRIGEIPPPNVNSSSSSSSSSSSKDSNRKRKRGNQNPPIIKQEHDAPLLMDQTRTANGTTTSTNANNQQPTNKKLLIKASTSALSDTTQTSVTKISEEPRKKMDGLVTSLSIFEKFITASPDGQVDVSGILSRECYEAWFASRPHLKHPEECFRKTLISHITVSDGASLPFTPEVEKKLLAIVRQKGVWPCFRNQVFADSGKPISIGVKGLRAIGYHERKQENGGAHDHVRQSNAKKRTGKRKRTKRRFSNHNASDHSDNEDD